MLSQLLRWYQQNTVVTPVEASQIIRLLAVTAGDALQPCQGNIYNINNTLTHDHLFTSQRRPISLSHLHPPLLLLLLCSSLYSYFPSLRYIVRTELHCNVLQASATYGINANTHVMPSCPRHHDNPAGTRESNEKRKTRRIRGRLVDSDRGRRAERRERNQGMQRRGERVRKRWKRWIDF